MSKSDGSVMVKTLDVRRWLEVPEIARECGPTTGDTRPHGADRDGQCVGNFRVVEVGHVAQDHGGAEILGQSCERGVEVESADDPLGLGASRGRNVEIAQSVWIERFRAPFPATEFIER